MNNTIHMSKGIIDIRKMLDNQNTPFDEFDILYELFDGKEIAFSIMDIYNYGHIQGKRAERAKRKAKYK